MMPNRWNRSNLLIAASGTLSTALIVAVYCQITGFRVGMVSGNPWTMTESVAVSTMYYLVQFAWAYPVMLAENFYNKKRS